MRPGGRRVPAGNCRLSLLGLSDTLADLQPEGERFEMRSGEASGEKPVKATVR